MNEYKIYTSLYGVTRNYRGIPYWMLTPVRRLIRSLALKRLPAYFEKHIADINRPRTDNLIVSLTSFPARIETVYLTVESLFRQSELPEKIILWLSKEQFHDVSDVPERLRKLENDLFSIRYVDGDIRSHKKYYYAFLEFPQKTVITVDDDIYYHPKMISILTATSKNHPNSVIANISKHILFDNNGVILSYRSWQRDVKPLDSVDMVQIGAGGVLYPPHCLNDHVLRKDIFWEVAPMADDLWLNMMARLNNTLVVQSKRLFLPLPCVMDTPSLKTTNTGEDNMNDKQLAKMIEWLVQNKMENVYSKC